MMTRVKPLAVIKSCAFFFFVAAALPSWSPAADRSTLIAEVRKFVPRASLASENIAVSAVAGHYSDQGPEVERRAGPALTGSELYLFPDGSYLATEWGCLLPETISDRGAWRYEGGYVELASDRSVSKRETLRERRFVVLDYRVGAEQGYRLMGTGRALGYFRANASAGDDFMLLLCSKVQIEVFDTVSASASKAKLLRTAWNPDYFK